MLAVAVGAGLLALNLAAQDAATTTAAPTLSPAAAQVLQLAQAKVGDDTIIAYIQNSDTIYGLNASQIVYLKQQGVSSAVINTMLNQRTRLAATGTQPDNSTASAQTSTAVAEPTATYVQTVPSSSVYVIPDTQTYDYDTYYYQPYYYPYYAWPYPAVSLSFGFGGHWGGGYYHGGGFHGGGFRGGGFHGIGRR